jgi:hypothetical protein
MSQQTASSQAATPTTRKMGNRSANFVRSLVKTPERRIGSGMTRDEKLKLASKLSDESIDTFMLLYVYGVFLLAVIVTVLLYRFKQESPHKFKGDVRQESLWTKFVNWLFMTPAAGNHPACNTGRPHTQPATITTMEPTCEETNRMFMQGTKGDGMC